MTKSVDPTFGPGLVRLWRSARNRAIKRLIREANLTPTQITGLRHNDLFRHNQPVRVLTIPARIERTLKNKLPRSVKLSDDLRHDLMVLNMMPFLLFEFPNTRPAFSSRTQGPPLSARQVGRVLKGNQPLRCN